MVDCGILKIYGAEIAHVSAALNVISAKCKIVICLTFYVQ